MNFRRIFVFAALAILVALVWLFWPKSKPVPLAVAPVPVSGAQAPAQVLSTPSPQKDAQGRILPVSPNAAQQQERRQPDPVAAARIAEAYLTPISFYGKVVDERGSPIEGATAKLHAADKPWQNSSEYERVSDADGLFSITGIRGAGLAVFVSKPGYYSPEDSQRGFAYGAPKGRGDSEIPTSNTPAIFMLRKMGEATPLIHFATKGFPIVEDGSSVEVNLATGKAVRNGGQVRVEVWSDDPTYGARGPYGWKARVTVPEGGLIERKDQFGFEAPSEGYAPVFEISMDRNAERWNVGFEREFFAQLADGHFARFTINLKTGGLFFTLESYLNPKPGSRNLEFDPAQQIPVKP